VGASMTANFFGYERVKLGNSNFACTFIGSIGTKPINNFGKSSRGHSHGLPKIFRALYIYGASRGHLCDSSAFLFIFDLLIVLLRRLFKDADVKYIRWTKNN